MAKTAQRFRIEGLKELNDVLLELPKSTRSNVLKRVLEKAAGPIERDAEAAAPVRKGKLKGGITITKKLSKRQSALARKNDGAGPRLTPDGWRSNPKTNYETYVGAGPHPQATLQEFGTAKHAAQPFMRPAWEANKAGALASIKDDLKTEIDKAVKRLAKKAEREAAKMKAGL